MKLSFVAGRGLPGRPPSATWLAGAFAAALCAGAGASDTPRPQSVRDGHGADPALLATPSSRERSRYIVVLVDPPLAAYDGRVSGYPAPLRKAAGPRAGRVDVASAPARAWLGALGQRQEAFVADVSARLGRPLDVSARLRHAINAVIVDLTDDEAVAVAARGDVRLVERERALEPLTDRSPAYVGAPAVWDGSATHGVATQGEGVVIGSIDSGLNWKSPAFSAVGPVDAYVHVNPLGAGNYLGLCGPTPPNADVGRCNDKLIGMYNFVSTLDSRSGTDDDGHGSHTASTAAGNAWDAPFGGATFRLSGIAPHANVVGYKVCTGTCPTSAIVQGVNQAVADAVVDVVNLSISGGVTPWTDTISVALLGAHDAGIVVATSAGNGGPDASTSDHQEPWTISTAAVQHDRLLAFSLSATAPGTPPPQTRNVPLRPGKPPLPADDLHNVPIMQSPNFSNGANDGCTAAGAYPPGTFTRPWAPPEDRLFADRFDPAAAEPPVRGIAVLNYGGSQVCELLERRDNAINAGAIGVVFVAREFVNLPLGGNTWSMRQVDFDAFAALDPAAVTVSIGRPVRAYPRPGDVVAPFSGRGPRALPNSQWLVKPDLAAPGVDVLAAWQAHSTATEDATATAVDNGTSMSAPHVAGAAALLRALHPAWTPTQVKSALALTAKNSGIVNANGQPATAWDRGAGRLDLAAAVGAGLVLDESGANFLAANPATGGNLANLNLPSLASGTCIGNCTYTRTVRRVRQGAQTYGATVEGYAAGQVDVSPATFTLGPGDTQLLTVTVHSPLLTQQLWAFGDILLTPGTLDEPALHLPVALRPGGPAIQVAPAALAGEGDGDVETISVSNVGNPSLDWSITTSGTLPVTPLNTVNGSNGQQAGYYNGSAKGYYWAQNFDVKASTRITTLRANGFTLPNTPMNASNTPTVTFSVYADASGVPAGAPEGFGAAPVWTYSNAIGTANGISAASGNLTLNLAAAPVAANPLLLPPGRYWLMVWPTLNGLGNVTPGNPLWAWRNSADPQIGAQPRAYVPSDDPTSWRIDPTLKALAAQVQGTVDCQQPAWISYAPTGGSLGYAGSTTVTATFDADGLAEGTYSATLCIGSNATNAPVVMIPVTFHVPGNPLTRRRAPKEGGP